MLRNFKVFTSKIFSFSSTALKSQAGFNLTELMIASALSGVVAIGASSIYIFLMDNFRVVVEQNTAQESLLWTAYHTKANLQSATVSLSYAVTSTEESEIGPSDPIVTSYTPVRFITYKKEFSDGGTGETRTGAISVANMHDLLDAQAAPADDVYKNRGVMGKVVFFRTKSDGSDWTGADGNESFANSSWYDRVVQYDQGANSQANSHYTINIATRYFIRYDEGRLEWRHPYDVGTEANVNRFYRDLPMQVLVQLRNTNYNMSLRSGLHGNIYYYRYLAPPVLLGLDYNE
ncbi:MAG: prepilin-type N-terminal cleavage/methylation domain-containing protein [Bdellovibrionota bacterium]|nr:prepilin-type N-terminal cleavage/methylation domain-containing protein [Bdellovibrionota bacterium]